MTKIFHHTFVLPALLLGLVGPLAAQNILYVEHGGKMLPVRRAKDTQAMVEVNGRLVPASGADFGLQKTEEYLPAFIAVRNFEVGSSSAVIMGTGHRINSKVRFEADFESPYLLENVFFVLELTFDDDSKALFLHEVGRLEPYKPIHLLRWIPITQVLGQGRYEIHLFVGGREVFTSLQLFVYRETMLDRMVAKRVAGVQAAAAKPFFGPGPEYPAKLAKAGIRGTASVRFRIGINGAVLDPEVANASDPAFGEAALAAVRQWRFLPGIKDGRPVETEAELPFEFAPPIQASEATPPAVTTAAGHPSRQP
jgi:TonB family protein